MKQKSAQHVRTHLIAQIMKYLMIICIVAFIAHPWLTKDLMAPHWPACLMPGEQYRALSIVKFERCEGVIAIGYFPKGDSYLIHDVKHDYHIALVDAEGQFTIVGEHLYLFDNRLNDTEPDLAPVLSYVKHLYTDPEVDYVVTEQFFNFEKLPHFYKINTSTGLVEYYPTAAEAAEEDKEIFESLMRNTEAQP